jgi:fatty acid desaturase
MNPREWGISLKPPRSQGSTLKAGLRALAYLCGAVGVVFFLIQFFLKIRILPTWVIVLLCFAGVLCFVIVGYMDMAAARDKEEQRKQNNGKGERP